VKNLALITGTLAAGLLSATACRRSDMQTARIDVPQMAEATAVRIVTNAALHEVVGQYDGLRHDFEVDLAGKFVLYHESERLLSPAYRRQIEARIAEVGYHARVTDVRLNPPPPVVASNGTVQLWPDRYTAVIVVSDLAHNTDANIIVDAIAYARLGHDDPRVTVDARSRRLVARYESLRLSTKNIEQAIACAGFAANDTPAKLGLADAVPRGWTAVRL